MKRKHINLIMTGGEVDRLGDGTKVTYNSSNSVHCALFLESNDLEEVLKDIIGINKDIWEKYYLHDVILKIISLKREDMNLSFTTFFNSNNNNNNNGLHALKITLNGNSTYVGLEYLSKNKGKPKILAGGKIDYPYSNNDLLILLEINNIIDTIDSTLDKDKMCYSIKGWEFTNFDKTVRVGFSNATTYLKHNLKKIKDTDDTEIVYLDRAANVIDLKSRLQKG